MTPRASLRVGIAGFGAIGGTIAARLIGGLPGLALTAVGTRDQARARAALPESVAVTDVASLAAHADLIVECAPAAVLPEIAEPALRAGRTLVVLSCGALLDRMDLVDLARASGGRIVVPTGALLGLDAVIAAAEGTIHAVRMTTRQAAARTGRRAILGGTRHHAGWPDRSDARVRGHGAGGGAGLPGEPQRRRGAVARGHRPGPHPAGDLGRPRPQPATCTRSKVDSDSAHFSMRIVNIPSENPRTGRITALSVVALLRKIGSPLAIGT